MYKISEERLRSLLTSELELLELEYAGVDNWEGFCETEDITEEDIDKHLVAFEKVEEE